MIIVETLPDNPDLVKTYSDKGVFLLQQDTGAKYADPIDLKTHTHIYVETDEPIENNF